MLNIEGCYMGSIVTQVFFSISRDILLNEAWWLTKVWSLETKCCAFFVLCYQATSQYLEFSVPSLPCNSTSSGNSHILKRVQLPPKENNLLIHGPKSNCSPIWFLSLHFSCCCFLVHWEVLRLLHIVLLKHCQSWYSSYLIMFWWVSYLASASHLGKVPITVLNSVSKKGYVSGLKRG